MNTTIIKDTALKNTRSSNPFARGAIINGRRIEHWRTDEKNLDQPLRWRRPRMIFVCAHGDLFHENVPDDWIDRVFAVMALAPQHTFQCLTKRPERARDYVLGGGCGGMRAYRMSDAAERIATNFRPWDGNGATAWDSAVARAIIAADWPLPNVWIGTSVEDQATADARIPHLLATPAAVRFVSAEPLLAPVDLWRHLWQHESINPYRPTIPCLDWIIVGGESGPGARVWDGFEDAARSLRDQCAAAGTAFFMKQMAGPRKSSMPPIPADLMVRQMPTVAT